MSSADRDSTDRFGVTRPSETAAIARLARFGGEALVAELTAMFLEDMPARFAAMHDAIREQDVVALSRSAHSMKSSSAQLGAEVLAHACDEVEAAADRGDLRDARHWIETVDVEYAAFTAWLSGRGVGRAEHVAVVPNEIRPVGRRTIAVVEDNADNRLLVDAILGDRFELHEYVNGGDALTGMAHRRPDLVLLDVSLPGMDGVEVVARLRRDPSLARVPVIALTAHAMTGDRERYLAAGFDGYVAKPIVDERDLTETVERLLDLAP